MIPVGVAWNVSGDPTGTGRRSIVNEEQHVVELYKACSRSLDTFHVESQRTLNFLALVSHSPRSTENNAALQFQLTQEKAAQTDYQWHRLDLLRGLMRLASGEREPL